MDKEYNIPVSIEKLAAYMDGNLTSDEARDVSIRIKHDAVLSEIMSVNQNVDNQLRLSPADEFSLPDELNSLDFNIPDVSLMPEMLDVDQSLGFMDMHQDYSLQNHENDSHLSDTSMGDDVTILDLNI